MDKVLVLILVINKGSAFELSDKFQYCTVGSSSVGVDLAKCGETTPMANYYTLYERLDYVMAGMGKVCTKYRVIITTYKPLWGQADIQRTVEPVSVTNEDCRDLIATKKCGQHDLTCSGDVCKYVEEPTYAVKWLQALSFEALNCRLHQTQIYAKSLTRPIFENAQSRCLPSDLFCISDNSTYVWEERLIEKCHYRPVETALFHRSGNTLFNKDLDVQIHSPFSACADLVLFSTNYGELFITRMKDLSSSASDSRISGQRQMAMEDRLCSLMKPYSNSSGHQSLVYRLAELDNLVVFVNNTRLTIPSCLNVQRIRIDGELDSVECSEKAHVTFGLSGRVDEASLSSYVMVSVSDRKQVCSRDSTLLLARETLPADQSSLSDYSSVHRAAHTPVGPDMIDPEENGVEVVSPTGVETPDRSTPITPNTGVEKMFDRASTAPDPTTKGSGSVLSVATAHIHTSHSTTSVSTEAAESSRSTTTSAQALSDPNQSSRVSTAHVDQLIPNVIDSENGGSEKVDGASDNYGYGDEAVETQERKITLLRGNALTPTEPNTKSLKIWFYAIVVINACTTSIVIVLVLVSLVCLLRHVVAGGCRFASKSLTESISARDVTGSLKTPPYPSYQNVQPVDNNASLLYENIQLSNEQKRKIYFYDV
jgi:hypothetical protein